MTEFTKSNHLTIKPGYQGKPDAMRDRAEKYVKMSNGKDINYSASCADKDKVRKYKKGGAVQKYAMGGTAKIRHEEATKQGLPRSFKKKSLKEIF